MADPVRRQLDSYANEVAVQLLEDCSSMARYALGKGRKLPEWLGNALAKIGAKAETIAGEIAATSERDSGDVSPDAAGSDQRAALAKAVRDDLRALTRIHAVLCDIVAPATPVSIRATAVEHGGPWGSMRSLPLLKWMLFISLSCLVLFVATTYAIASGSVAASWTDLLPQVSYLATAGLGASFYALFTANRYVVAGTFDPKYNPVYWVRFCLGILAGMMLANLWNVDLNLAISQQFQKSTVALLGGYSAQAVNLVLSRLVDLLVSAVRGETRTIIAARTAEVEARVAKEEGGRRLRLAALLMEIEQDLVLGTDAKDIRGKLKPMLDEFLYADSDGEPPTA